jgi:hypothetical protein
MVSWWGGTDPMTRPPYRFFPVPFSLGTTLAAFALIAWAGLSGCKTVDIDPPDKDTVSTDSATIRVTNQIKLDPDSLTFFLFRADAVDFSNAADAKRLGGVDTGATVPFKVPAGSWKLAYEDKSGDLVPMRDENSGGLEWLRAIFVKNAEYSLIISTDGNRNAWHPTFKTEPAMQ